MHAVLHLVTFDHQVESTEILLSIQIDFVPLPATLSILFDCLAIHNPTSISIPKEPIIVL